MKITQRTIREFCTLNYTDEPILGLPADDIKDLNTFKILTLIPGVGTVAAARLLHKVKKASKDGSYSYPEGMIIRAYVALVPFLGTAALATTDLIGTPVKYCKDKFAK